MKSSPSFKYYEGRALLRRTIVDHFPTAGVRYIEPFAGAGNVYFEAKSRLDFEFWHLNDTSSFLNDLLTCSLMNFPREVTRSVFDEWAITETPEANVLAREITYGGRGYHAGFVGEQLYKRDALLDSCWRARTLLRGASVTHSPWTYIPYGRLRENDFVYFDPPTHGRIADLYDNIDHSQLGETLLNAKFNWVLTHSPHLYYKNLLSRFNHIRIDEKLDLWKNFN